MNTIRVSATEARNDFFTLLNKVIFGDTRVVIEKAGADREVILTASEVIDKKVEKRLKTLDASYGIFKDSPVTGLTDDRLRRRQAKKFLAKIRNA
jgi:prevent-host-death family protein